MAESEVECSSGIKTLTAQYSKTEGGIKRKKTRECEADGRRAWGDFTSRNTRRMKTRVLSELNFKLAFRSKRTCFRWIVLSLVFYKMPDQGSS